LFKTSWKYQKNGQKINKKLKEFYPNDKEVNYKA